MKKLIYNVSNGEMTTVEDITPDDMIPIPQTSPEPTEKERIDALESALLGLMEMLFQ